MGFWNRLAAGAAVCLFVSASSVSAQSVRVFTDWHAACDNLRSCSLLGLSPENAEVYAFIQLRRGGEPLAPLDASFVFTFETELPELPLEITFTPPGAPDLFAQPPMARIGRDGLLRIDLDAEATTKLLEALRKTDQVRIRRLDDAPPEESETIISLKGAAAAMRWMDDQQQRVGTVTALVARGERPASATPQPAAAPTYTPAAYQPRQLEGKAPADVVALWRKNCPDQEAIEDGEEIGHQIAAETILWQLPCFRGAYNFGVLFITQGRTGAPRLVPFERPENGALKPDTSELISGEFNDEDRTVFFFAKGRGPGDCGSRGSYVWDGRAFRLTLWQEMIACRGAPLELWPVVWRANVRARR